MNSFRAPWLLFTLLMLPRALLAQAVDPLVAPYSPDDCSFCVEWNVLHEPFQVFGNTYYVGTDGLASILITSPDGHVLIDGGLPDSAPIILDNIRALGFEITDVALILNSHAHHDHAGGLAALERDTGARIAATAPSATILEAGRSGPGDPQFGEVFDFPPVSGPVERVADGQTLEVGVLSLTAHLTAGHTPGGTTWSWVSCEDGVCRDMVYADSLTPVSADGFRYTDSEAYPTALEDFERGFERLELMACNILLTPHPGASSLWQRVQAAPDGLVDTGACARYAETARAQLGLRLATEAAEADGAGR